MEEASDWAHALTRAECRFPGDYGPAMARVARDIGVPGRLLWRLRYRAPKTIDVHHYAALGAAYADERYRAARAATTAKTTMGALLLGVADRLVGEDFPAVGEAGSDEVAGDVG